jgi:signal transduction histidine kinase
MTLGYQAATGTGRRCPSPGPAPSSGWVLAHTATAGDRRRLVLIFIGTLGVGLAVGLVALREVGGTSRSVDEVLSAHVETVLEVEHLGALSERIGRLERSYLLIGESQLLAELHLARQAFAGTATLLRARLDNEESRRILDLVRRLEDAQAQLADKALGSRGRRSVAGDVVMMFEHDVRRTREQMDLALSALGSSERREFEDARLKATASARASMRLLLAVAAVSVVLAGVLAWLLNRTLSGLERSRHALDASLDKLGRANRDLDAFAGRIAHDLRNILAPLPLNAARLRRELSPAALEQAADKIERIARRADGLIEALLAFARAGQPPEPLASASVPRAVHAAVDDLAHLRSLINAEVSVDLEDVEVRVAENLLYTVIVNLLTNALKFVEGHERREVRITARKQGPLVELTVEDSGPGIPVDAQSRIFQPFYRAPGAKGAGTGIGLATVQRIVEAYGGRIAVRSQPGQGACFTIRLPAGDRLSPPAPTPALDESPVIH